MESRKENASEKLSRSIEQLVKSKHSDEVLALIHRAKNPLDEAISLCLPALARLPHLPPDTIANIFIFIEQGIADKKFEPEEVNLRFYMMLMREKEDVVTQAIKFLASAESDTAAKAAERILMCLKKCEQYSEQKKYHAENISRHFQEKFPSEIARLTDHLKNAGCVQGLQILNKWMRCYGLYQSHIMEIIENEQKQRRIHPRSLLDNLNDLLMKKSSLALKAESISTLDDIGFQFASRTSNPPPIPSLSHSYYLRGVLQTVEREYMPHAAKNTTRNGWFLKAAGKAHPHPIALMELAASSPRPLVLYNKAIETLDDAEKFHLDSLTISVELIKKLFNIAPSNEEQSKEIDDTLLKLIGHHLNANNFHCIYMLLFEMPAYQRIRSTLKSIPITDERRGIYFEIVPCLYKILEMIGDEKKSDRCFSDIVLHYSSQLLKLDPEEHHHAFEKITPEKVEDFKKEFPGIAFRLAAFHLGYYEEATTLNLEKANKWLYFIVNFPDGIDFLKRAYEAGDRRALGIFPILLQLPDLPSYVRQRLELVNAPPEAFSNDVRGRLDARFVRLLSQNSNAGFGLHDQKQKTFVENILSIKFLADEKKWDKALETLNDKFTTTAKTDAKSFQATMASDIEGLKKDLGILLKNAPASVSRGVVGQKKR